MLRGVRINVHEPAVSVRHQNRTNRVLDFRNTKIPSFIITVVQVCTYLVNPTLVFIILTSTSIGYSFWQ